MNFLKNDYIVGILSGILTAVLAYILLSVMLPVLSNNMKAVISALVGLVPAILSRTIAGLLKEYLWQKLPFSDGQPEQQSGNQSVEADGDVSASTSQEQDGNTQSQETDIDINGGSFEANQSQGPEQ